LDSIKKKQTIENETDVNFNNITKTNDLEKALIYDEVLSNEQPEMISLEQLEKTNTSKSSPKKDVENTFHEIRLPKNKEEQVKSNRSKMVDNIIIIVLVILIVVLGYLLYNAFIN
ncbi:MAG: hypothetical protein ACRCTA_05410, partial [Bacilli bacterium]